MDGTMNKEDRRISIMEREDPVRAVLRMGLPVAMGMLFMVAYNLVDTYFIGQLKDAYQLAAANLSYPVLMVMIALSGIVGNGGASYIARCMGAGETEEAERTLIQGVEMIFAMGLLLALAGIFFAGPIARILGARSDTFDATAAYSSIILMGSFFTMGNYAFGQLLRSEGSTGYSTIGMILGTVANIILDPVFIFTLGMEIKGAAIATVLGNALSVLYFVWIYHSGRSLLKLNPGYIGFSLRIFREIMLVGIPHTLEQFLSTGAILVLNNLAAAYGGLTVAAMGISSKIMSFGNYIYQGITAGCQPLMGYNYGAGNYRRLRQLIRAGILVVTVTELAVMGFYALAAPFLIGLFTEDPVVLEPGVRTLRAALLILPFVGTTAMVRNMYNAIGMPMYAFSITLVRQLVLYIPFLIFFNRTWGYTGLIHAQPAEEALCLLLSVFLLHCTLERLNRDFLSG